jgi:PAS domain S-box-containing protein
LKKQVEAVAPDNIEQLKMAYDQAIIYAQELKGEIIERRRAEAELDQRVAQLSLINGIGRRIAAVLDLDTMLDTTVGLVQETFDYHHVALFLVDRKILRLKAVAGLYKTYYLPGHTQSLSEGIAGWVASYGETVIANDVSADPHYISPIPKQSITQAELCLPIKIAGLTVGVLDIQSPYLDAFGKSDVIVMETLTNQIAVSIGNARLYEATQQELAERKRAEQALQQAHDELEQRVGERTAELHQSKERYRDLFDNANDLIQSINTEGYFSYVNRSWLEAMGYTAEEVTNLHLEDVVHPDQVAHCQDLFQHLQAGERLVNERLVFITKAGRELVVEGTLNPYFEGERFVASRGILRDITERERAEEALATRLRYEQALSACSQVLLANIEAEEALTETLYELLIATDTSRVYIFENFEDATDGLCMRQTRKICALEVKSERDNPVLQHLPYAKGFERWQTELLRGQSISGLVESFPQGERDILEPLGVLSILILPIWVEGEWYGFIGFEDIHRPREWSKADIKLLQTGAGMIGVFIERKRAEETLRESEEKYRTLIEQSSDAIYLIYGGRFEVISRRFEELFGVTPEDVSEPNFVFKNIVAPKSRGLVKKLTEEESEEGKPRPRYEFTALDKDGNEIEVELTVSYPNYRGGLATQGIIRDITERKRIEEEKQKAYQQVQQYADELAEKIKEEQRQREIATILAEVVASVSLTLSTDELLDHILLKLRQLVSYDSAAIFLVEGEQLVIEAARGFDMKLVDQQHSLEQDALFQEMLARKSYVLIEDTREDSRFQHWRGAEKVRCWVGAPLIVAQEVIGYLTLDRYKPGAFTLADADLAQAFAHQVAQAIHNARLFVELHEAQTQLIQRERLAALGQMAATVAHELRNPLMSIRLGVEYLLNDVTETDPRRQGAVLMQANMDRIDRIVEDILFISRAPQPTLTPDLLQLVIEDELNRWELTLAEKNIVCHTQLEPGLPPLSLDCDQMGRALSNLIGNSIDAMGPGGELRLTLHRENSNQIITLSDNGPGISPEHESRIFEPFFTTKSRGTGLGLSIVKQIIEYHQGSIDVWSEVDIGTKFTISLPQTRRK